METENHVFSRRMTDDQASDLISPSLYNVIIGGVLLWGFGINWLMIRFIPVKPLLQINPWIFLLAYLGSCFLGIYVLNKSQNPLISFVGYNLIVVPFGFIVNIVTSRYDPLMVIQAVQITAIATLIMMILGASFPQFFEKIGLGLTISLLVAIVVELVMVFVFRIRLTVIDWIVALIFCGYIGYDWARANNIPRTVDNAVDSAAALYMDIINLFLRILRIMGRRR